MPGLLWVPEIDSAGWYVPPGDPLEFEGLAVVEVPRGLIVLGDDPTPATIAHEWRHHWQMCRGLLPDQPGHATPLDSSAELDAVRFELATGPDDTSREWRERLGISTPPRLEAIDNFLA